MLRFSQYACFIISLFCLFFLTCEYLHVSSAHFLVVWITCFSVRHQTQVVVLCGCSEDLSDYQTIIIIIIIFMRWGAYGSKRFFHLWVLVNVTCPSPFGVMPGWSGGPQWSWANRSGSPSLNVRLLIILKHTLSPPEPRASNPCAHHCSSNTPQSIFFWSGAIVSDGPIMEICLKCFALRPSELHRLHLLMCWACKQLLSPHFSATFLHNLVSPT